MRTWTEFVSHFEAHKNSLPASARRSIRAIAVDRVRARMMAGRADSPLDFSDLVDAIETGIAPRA